MNVIEAIPILRRRAKYLADRIAAAPERALTHDHAEVAAIDALIRYAQQQQQQHPDQAQESAGNR